MDLTPERKAAIDNMSVYALLYKCRFCKVGDPFFQGERGEYALKRLAELRDQDTAAYVAASKSMGW